MNQLTNSIGKAQISDIAYIFICGANGLFLYYAGCVLGFLSGFDFNYLLFTRFDADISLSPWWSIPYTLVYVYPFATLVFIFYKYNDDRLRIYKFFIAYLSLFLIGIIFIILFPSSSKLLYEFKANETFSNNTTLNFFMQLNAGNLISLRHYGAFPSLHVGNAWLTFLICRKMPKVKWLFLTCTSLIIISTIMIRAHYFLDVFGGILLGQIAFLFYTSNNEKFIGWIQNWLIPNRHKFFITFNLIIFSISLGVFFLVNYS